MPVQLFLSEVNGKAVIFVLEGCGCFDFTMLDPTILENVPETCKVEVEEVFGPVCTVSSFSDFKSVRFFDSILSSVLRIGD